MIVKSSVDRQPVKVCMEIGVDTKEGRRRKVKARMGAL